MIKIYHGITKVGMIAASLLATYAVGMVAYLHVDDIKRKKKQKEIKLR